MNIIKSIWKHSKIWLIVTSIILVLIMTVSLVLTQNQMLKGVINLVMGGERQILVSGNPNDPEFQYYSSDYSSKSETLKNANILNEKIVSEGIILLENKDNALPLKEGSRVSVFGNNSVNLVYGGSGSSGSGVTSNETTLYESLDAVNIKYNSKLKEYYETNSTKRPKNPGMDDGSPAGMSTGEINPDLYFNNLKTSFASDYKDAAFFVISRVGGEGFDLPRKMEAGNYGLVAGEADSDSHYLQLTNYEKKLLEEIKKCNFDEIIIIINCNTQMELGFIKDDPQITGAIWIGSTGKSGASAIGKILVGEVNPSGRTVDTYSRNFKDDPTWRNFGNNLIKNGNKYYNQASNRVLGMALVEYQESIYVGYRYYETRGFTKLEKDGSYDWYDDAVVYPFGYGLSYATFEWEILTSQDQPEVLKQYGQISIDVKVKNTSETYSGKDVVQLYVKAPYNDGKVEKSHVVLGGFAKTKLLEPGEEQTLTITMKVSDLASYDSFGLSDISHKGWILDSGEYSVYVSKNAHSWAKGADELKYSVPTGGFKYDEGDKDRLTENELISALNPDAELRETPYKDSDGENIDDTSINRFDNVSNYFKNKSRALLSRVNDFSNFDQLEPPSLDFRKISIDYYSKLEYPYVIDDKTDDKWYVANAPKYSRSALSNAKTQVRLYELRGVDYFDPLWDKLLDQLSISQMANLIETGAFQTANIDNISKPKTTDADGPAGFTNFMELGGSPTVYDTCFYASECVLGATWNIVLGYEMGKMIGNEGYWGNVRGDGRAYSGWYAPAMNIHRSQFGGRNWEYYSEDGFLSGKMGSAVVTGAMEKGVYTYLKHFVLNDQESERAGVLTWTTEQAMREIYFRPFEICVKGDLEFNYQENDQSEEVLKTGIGTSAIMSSFNRIGDTWTGGSYELQIEVLRYEWGFKGMIISDYNTGSNYMDVDLMIRAGGDLNLWTGGGKSSLRLTYSSGCSKTSSTQIASMRRATKNILYTVANSNAMNGMGPGVVYRYAQPLWIIWLIIADIAIFAGLAVWGFFAVRKAVKKEKKRNEVR